MILATLPLIISPPPESVFEETAEHQLQLLQFIQQTNNEWQAAIAFAQYSRNHGYDVPDAPEFPEADYLLLQRVVTQLN